MKRLYLFSFVLAVVTLGGCSKLPEIQVTKIEKDILGQSIGYSAEENVGEGFAVWVFNERDTNTVSLVETKYDKEKAKVIIDAESRRFPLLYTGRLRLDYEYIADQWTLQKIKNLSFKESFKKKAAETTVWMMGISQNVRIYRLKCGIEDQKFPQVSSITELATLVGPHFPQKLPLKDAWGNEFLFTSNAEGYELRSMGFDGEVTPVMLDTLSKGKIVSSFEDDLIIKDLKEKGFSQLAPMDWY